MYTEWELSLRNIAKKLNHHHSLIDIILKNYEKTVNYDQKEGRDRNWKTTSSEDTKI